MYSSRLFTSHLYNIRVCVVSDLQTRAEGAVSVLGTVRQRIISDILLAVYMNLIPHLYVVQVKS